VTDDARRTRLRAALLDWARASLRDTPWRRTRDPWQVLVSEVMLQQTQVDRVVPRWEAFVQRFPDPASCAAAPVAEVIRLWQGLGYNRRAVALHGTAVAVVEHHGGTVPVELDELLALPGVGPYTARAVRVFAHGRRDAVVDVNVERVLRRAVVGGPLGRTATQALADELVHHLDDGDVWTWNQAVMELGARHCRKRGPRCVECPLVAACAWAGTGEDPAAGTGSTQSHFDGSDRQGRGRIVDAVRTGPLRLDGVPAVTGWADDERVARVVDGLVADGLVRRRGDTLLLPDGPGG
jgi:A/G-specific adenine glycosylase